MSVISFDDWKRKKERSSAFNSRGDLREDIALKEEYGFDLCVFISEELNAGDGGTADVEQLWQDLRALTASLPHEHAYFYFQAFEAFHKQDEATFLLNLDKFLQSEKTLYGDIAECDWWIDNFVWVFAPPFVGMYGRCAELFFKHWPLCAMGWVCEALEESEAENENPEAELDLLMMAVQADPKCYLAHFLVAMLFYDQRQWKSALPYFEKAARSSVYSNDASFYFDFAWAAEKAGKLDYAYQLYQSVLALDERYPCAVNNLGCVLLRMNKLDEAYKEFNRAINLGLDGALPYRNIVATLERQGKYAECLKFIEANLERLGRRYSLETDRLKLLESSEGNGMLGIQEMSSSGRGDNEQEGLFGKRMLEDEIETLIESGQGVFGRKLRIYEDENGYGRHYYVPGAGRIDLLAIDEADQTLCVISAHNAVADERALLVIWQQISAARKAVAKRWQKVCGYIVCPSANETLKASKKAIKFEDVHLFEYRFVFDEV